MADRGLLLSRLPTQGLRGFEIGALMSPFLSKADNDLLLVDRLSTEELREQFAGDPNVCPDSIAKVDVVVRHGALAEALRQQGGAEFDYAIASHVIEHIPDVIGWLSQLAELVRIDGHLLLVVPDKRYTFDYLRDLSTLPDLIDAWVRENRKPAPGQVFDYSTNTAAVDKLAAWSGPLDPSTLTRFGTPSWALERAVQSCRADAYVDSHCWVFTPGSFLDLCAGLARLELLQWKLVFFADTRYGDVDFGLVLQRTASGESPDAIAATFSVECPGQPPAGPDLRAEVARMRAELDMMRASRSWRLTAPLRRIAGTLRKAAGRKG